MNIARRVVPWVAFCVLGAAALGQDAPPIAGIVAPGAKVVKLHGGFAFTEGPALAPDGNVYFTDLPNERIHIWTPQGKLLTYREKSGRANGLAFDKQGRLLACEMNNGRVSVTGPDGKPQVLVGEFQGKPFNQTNDLVVDAKGGVYFSDPYYGPERSLPQDRMAVYYLKPDGKMVQRVCDRNGAEKPNGVLLSPDGKTLYVIDSENPTVWCYNVGDDGYLTPGGNGTGKFAQLRLPPGVTKSGGDGGAVDAKGNVYVTSALGVQVISPKGEILGVIPVAEQPANCAFAGKDLKTLFITARQGIYAITLEGPGLPLPAGKTDP